MLKGVLADSLALEAYQRPQSIEVTPHPEMEGEVYTFGCKLGFSQGYGYTFACTLA